ncbi:SigE family RNA polymerase sigma factor [Nocardioides caldifontis]|uniref:SigE family RNA polymerase sigma factor n=1 Tax=Nocardioides caldifontis TaxID=2588938 RepID=UPI0011E000C6|nr:SigE family RNA polymerase sigma factor [Nocardioides caldifontis]
MNRAHDQAFSDFVAARWAALFRSAYLLTGNRHEAEDLLQTALANTYVAWPRIRDLGALEGYVRRALVNAASRGWRARGRTVVTDAVPDPGHDGGLGVLGDRATLWQAVCDLPPRMRATLVLRYYEELSEAETAAALGCSTGSVKSQTHHALKRLRAALADHTSLVEEPR